MTYCIAARCISKTINHICRFEIILICYNLKATEHVGRIGKIGHLVQLWRQVRAGFVNRNRFRFEKSRKAFFLLSPLSVVLLLFFLIEFASGKVFSMEHLGFLGKNVVSTHIFLLILYFASIEPEPPSKSKLKKLLGKIKEMCSTDALPQPA